MSDVSRHRLRWWLRAEQAMGLKHVYVPGGVQIAPVSRPATQQTAPPAPRTSTTPQALASSGPSVALPSAVRPAAARPAATIAVDSQEVAFVPDPSPVMFCAPTEPFQTAELSPADKVAALKLLDDSHVKGCTKCPLCNTRRNTVFGEGDANARLMFIGEGPGATEDETGRPFVGKAGQKLTEMIEKGMGVRRGDVYICNVVKCRAFLTEPYAKDRPPQPAEAAACMPYLERQIELVRPRVIVTLGLSASQYLLGTKESMTRMRGKWRQWRGIPVMPTFHPSYILRNYTAETRRAVWEDLKQVVMKLSVVSNP